MTIHKPATYHRDPYTIPLVIIPVGPLQIEDQVWLVECNEKPDPRWHTRGIPIYRVQKVYLHYLVYTTHYYVHVFFVQAAVFHSDHHLTNWEYQYYKIVCSITYPQKPDVVYFLDHHSLI